MKYMQSQTEVRSCGCKSTWRNECVHKVTKTVRNVFPLLDTVSQKPLHLLKLMGPIGFSFLSCCRNLDPK